MKTEKVGNQSFETPVRCEYCEGKGEVLKSKLRMKPLYDRYGRPIDQLGKLLKRPDQEPWYRRKRREQQEKKV